MSDSQTLVVTRDQFMDLIEAALVPASDLPGDAVAKLRAFGVSGTEAAVGSYSAGCPISQVFGVTGEEETLAPGYEDFAYGFDDAVRDLRRTDPGFDLPDFADRVVVK